MKATACRTAAGKSDCTCAEGRACGGGSVVLQRKLALGKTDDPLEHQADRAAHEALRAPRAPSGGAARVPLPQRPAVAHGATPMAVPPSVERVLAGSGGPLEPALRTEMEGRFGVDFSRVRIHHDDAAARSARDVQAHAYTAGADIVFGAGRYAPRSETGRHLLAHELAHVVQQTGASPRGVGRPPPMAVQRQGIASGLCRQTARYAGNLEHELIESDYVSNVNPGAGAVEYSIPESGPSGGTGYADLVDTASHKIYEIKTYIGAPKGEIEALNYAYHANEHCAAAVPASPWTVGNDYPPRTIPMGNDREIVAQQYPEFSGVVVYYTRKRQRVPDPVNVPVTAPSSEKEKARQPAPRTAPQSGPVPIPQTAMEQIRDFLKQALKAGTDANTAAREFLTRHPELIDYAKGLAIGVFLGTIAEDVVTAGAGLLDDPATMALAAALWRAASQLQFAR